LEDIKAIIKLLSKQKVKQIEILSEESKLSEKSLSLYNGIKEGSITNDDEASAFLYNDDRNNPIYRVLKHRFKERLINTLFFIDVQAYGKSAHQKALNRNLRNWAASQILLNKGLSTAAISIMETTLKSTIKFDMIELSLLILKDLKMHYGLYNYNKKKYEKYKNQWLKISHINQLKAEAEELYISTGHILETKKSTKYDSRIKKYELRLVELNKQALKIDSYYFRYYVYISNYIINMIKRDYKKQQEISKEALIYFKTKKGFNNYGVASFQQINGIIELNLKKYDLALSSFLKCLDFKPLEGRLYWQAIYNYIFLIHILKREYDQAYKILSYIINHKSFKNIYSDFKQHWFLKEAFIQFLVGVGKIQPDKIKAQKLRPFRITRFINEIPALTADKRGYNVSIHIVHLLFLIIDEKYDVLIDKLDSLKQYSFRYLKSEEYTRARTFIKMLLMIPKYDYHTKTILTKTKNLHQKLMDTPMDFSEQAMSIEIIPYEQLWEEVMGLLELI